MERCPSLRGNSRPRFIIGILIAVVVAMATTGTAAEVTDAHQTVSLITEPVGAEIDIHSDHLGHELFDEHSETAPVESEQFPFPIYAWFDIVWGWCTQMCFEMPHCDCVIYFP